MAKEINLVENSMSVRIEKQAYESLIIIRDSLELGTINDAVKYLIGFTMERIGAEIKENYELKVKERLSNL